MKKEVRNSLFLKALKSIGARGDGTVSPYDVVEAARNPDSSIHKLFLLLMATCSA